MQQYEYSIKAADGYTATVYCTAAKPEWARLQVCMAYKGYTVSETPLDSHAPHRIYGEIDASTMTQKDYDYFVSKL